MKKRGKQDGKTELNGDSDPVVKPNSKAPDADNLTATPTRPENMPPQPADLEPLAVLSRNTTRREVVKGGLAVASLFAAIPAAARWRGDNPSLLARTLPAAGKGRLKTENRDFVFDFSNADTSSHELTLIAGRLSKKIKPLSKGRLKQLRKKYPLFRLVPDSRATHYINIDMPADGLQLCYVQRRLRGRSSNSGPSAWDMMGMFTHTPKAALLEAADIIAAAYGDELPPAPFKWERLGVRTEDLAMLNDPIGVDSFKDDSDTASTMIMTHPETACYDPTTNACINATIISGDTVKPAATNLAETICGLGPAAVQQGFTCGTPPAANPAGYATMVPVCNPDTGVIAKTSRGDDQQIPFNHPRTDQAAGQAVQLTIQQIKDDPTLGGNTTTDPDQTTGYIYRTQDGVSTVDQSVEAPQDGSDLKVTTKDFSPGHGYAVTVTDFAEVAGLTGLVSIKVSNIYVRYLGIYVRYLDGDGNPIAVSDLSLTSEQRDTYFPLLTCCSEWSTTNDQFINLVGPEFEILGIPTTTTTATFDVPIPTNAESVLILGSGMGNTSKAQNETFYPTTIPGASMTGIFNLSLPTMFLLLNAAGGLTSLNSSLKETTNVIKILPVVLQLFAATFDEIGFDDPSQFKSLALQIGQTLLTDAAKPLTEFIVTALTEGETQQDLLDAIPVIGGFLALVSAIGAIAQIAETSAQVANSPSTYQYEVGLTHDIVVKIGPDPKDAAGWPATATDFVVLAQFDNTATPQTAPIALPPGTFSGVQTVTLKNVPLGGKVTISVVVYTATNFQIGYASKGPLDNLDPSETMPLTVEMNITEFQVPLDETTRYSHKEVIELKIDGTHQWDSPAPAPTETAISGCGFNDGQICKLAGITINSTAGDVGYVFESYSSAAGLCGSNSGSPQQLFQFANMSITDNPQSTYFYSGCGFRGSPRIVYDLLNKPDNNYYIDTSKGSGGGIIRQIRLSTGNVGFDEPDSNKAFGQLRFPSDALLLHPSGRLISLSTSRNKLEVLQLPATAVTDAEAPLTQAYGGQGSREGLMDAPLLAALAPGGIIVVLERNNNRLQAFDLNVNANPAFKNRTYFVPLREQDTTNFEVNYLDLAIEFKGYIYVLYSLTPKLGTGNINFALDIYTPDGTFLSSTPDFIADKITVNYWRDVFAESYRVLKLPNGTFPTITEPAISHWIPSTPPG